MHPPGVHTPARHRKVRALQKNSHSHKSHPMLCLTSSFMAFKLREWVRAESSPSALWLAMCLRLKSSLWAAISSSVRCLVSAELLTGLGTVKADVLARCSASADRLWAWRMLS